MVHINFSAAFERVNHQGVLFKLSSLGVEGWVLSVRQGSVLGPQLFILYTSELFSIVENKLYGYADDYILVADVPSAERVGVIESINRDLNRVSVW